MKHIKVGVVRSSSTDLYIGVPDDFELDAIFVMPEKVGEIAKKTTMEGEWDDYDWHRNIDIVSAGFVSEAEATQFKCGEITPETAQEK